MLWKDRKGIYFLSNYHNVTDVTSVGRRNKDGSREEITCPKLNASAEMYVRVYATQIIAREGSGSTRITEVFHLDIFPRNV